MPHIRTSYHSIQFMDALVAAADFFRPAKFAQVARLSILRHRMPPVCTGPMRRSFDCFDQLYIAISRIGRLRLRPLVGAFLKAPPNRRRGSLCQLVFDLSGSGLGQVHRTAWRIAIQSGRSTTFKTSTVFLRPQRATMARRGREPASFCHHQRCLPLRSGAGTDHELNGKYRFEATLSSQLEGYCRRTRR